MKKLIVFLMIVLLLTSCAPASYGAPLESVDMSGETNNVSRYIDNEAGVVCYLFVPRTDTAGISCLPISQTNLN